ncbi:uncharacterized protein [Engystomops pustulosus]|uniref:uncharacterized protein n=1 Tax=Engystomops pustulosus TaxID=76066 RepID=UPI003AFB6F67
MFWGLFLAVIFCFEVEKSRSEIPMKSQPPKPNKGENVTLLFEYGDTINMVNWYRGRERIISKNILSYNPSDPSSVTIGKMHNGRIQVTANGSLEISNVTASDSGNYTLVISSPNTFDSGTYELTVNSHVTVAPPHLKPTDGQAKDGNTPLIIGVIIGSVVAVILVVAASLIWHRRRGCNKSQETPDSIHEKPTLSSPNEDMSFKPHKNINRRLPSIPAPTVYQNENNECIQEDEHPYTDLTYIYLSGSYHELQSP